MSASAARRPLNSRNTAWAASCARAAASIGLRPNQISVLSLLFAVMAAVAFWWIRDADADSRPWLLLAAAAGIQLRLLCNMLDGMVAIEGGFQSRRGELYNELPDRLADVFIFASCGYACPSAAWMPAAGWLAAVLAVLTAYVRALGGALGLKQDFCGPMAKPHRMFTLTLACLIEALASWLNAGYSLLLLALTIVCVGSLVTIARRIARIARLLDLP